MRLIDQQFLLTPFYGSRRIAASLERSGETVNRKRVQRLMAKMGLGALVPQAADHHRGPHAAGLSLLAPRSGADPPRRVWSPDITYVPMRHGFMYLTAVIDWYNMSDLGLCVN